MTLMLCFPLSCNTWIEFLMGLKTIVLCSDEYKQTLMQWNFLISVYIPLIMLQRILLPEGGDVCCYLLILGQKNLIGLICCVIVCVYRVRPG